MNEPGKYILLKEVSHTRPQIPGFYFHEMSRRDKFIEAESRLVVASG
jgi:hypothetical protein